MCCNKKKFLYLTISIILLGGGYGITFSDFSTINAAEKNTISSKEQRAKFYIINPSKYPLKVQCGTYGESIVQGSKKYSVEFFSERSKAPLDNHYYFMDTPMGQNANEVNCIIKFMK